MSKCRDTIASIYSNANKRGDTIIIRLYVVIRHFLQFDYPNFYDPFGPGNRLD